MTSPPGSVGETATLVAAGATRTRYDGLSIGLHWLTVVLVLGQLLLAQTWGWFPRPSRHLMIVAHMSFGIVLAGVVLFRIVWRLTPGHQMSAADRGWRELAAKTVHYSLYLMLLTEAVLGFVLRWSGAEAMSFFGFEIPPLIAPFSKPAHQVVGDAHEWLGWLIVAVATGHGLAALYHHYVLRDEVLQRMLPARPRT